MEIAIAEATRRTMPMTSVPVPTNFRRSSSRIVSGGGGLGAGVPSAFPPSAGAPSLAIAAGAAVPHLNVARAFAFSHLHLARPKAYIEPASCNGPRPGGLAVYDLGLSSRVLGFESRPGRFTL